MKENLNQSGNVGLVVIGVFLLVVIFGVGGYFMGLGKQFIPQKASENVADTNNSRDVVINNQTYTPPPIAQYKSSDIKEYLVVLGGNVGDRASDISSISNTVEMYDPISNRWQNLPSMIYSRARVAAATLGSNIFVFGGAVQGSYYVNKAEMFNRESNQWYEIAAPPGSSQVFNFNAFSWGNKIYLVYTDPQGNDFKSYVYTFNIQKNNYTKYSSPPKAVNRCFTQGNKFYCFMINDQTSVLKYSVDSDKWEAISIENRTNVDSEFVGSDYGIYSVGINDYGTNLVRFDSTSAKFILLGVPMDEIEGKKLHAYDLGMLGNSVVIVGGQTDHYVAQKTVYVFDQNPPFAKLPDMAYARSNTAIVTLPLLKTVPGGSIRGIVLEKAAPLSSRVHVVLHKLITRNPDGSILNKIVADQFIGTDGVFEFTGLDDGEYNLSFSGDYNAFGNALTSQEYIKISNASKVDNLNITACQTLGSCLSN